ncbi:MAG: peptidylprolyl isomerase [Xanthomonadaceae bacterium]|nr:peptidylprolyl isomerase [Xanthomonadaceae bacterium]
MRILILSLNVLFLAGFANAAVELAKVNGKPITEKDLLGALAGLTDVQRDQVLKDKATKRQVLDNVIEQEILFQQAEKDKFNESAEYKTALEGFKKQYLANMLIQKKITGKVTESSAKTFYSKNKDKFSTDQVHALHILLENESEALKLFQDANKKDSDFQQMAEKYSKDPSAKNNRGDLGFFTRDRMVPEFSDAAFKAPVNKVIGPIKTPFGYHLIKVVDVKTGKTLDYNEVELQVKSTLRQSLIKELVADLKKGAKIEIN